MNNESQNLLMGSTTTLNVGLVLSALFLGTGGSAASISINPDRGVYSQAIIANNSSDLAKVLNDDTSGNRREFQKLSLQIFETFGFSIKQYSEIMQVTRATIYKWHNLNAPLKKVQSKNRDRLNTLNDSLFGIKESRRKYFANWLRNPLDENANLVFSLLTNKKIHSDSVIEQIKNVNIGLHSLKTSNELDKLLGLS
ncbi:hypothetical protein [uncultured Paraglaciecola sp.]|uniref:hypothetical protein n=1 Tax=uncultured Paraglaciecola sp. TaxID=1765024 RepID=UPI002594130E|nr:hypothetical protein [uncultured Paraglaciecola sp.]